MPKYRKSTIKQVAEMAGVSTTTISYFMSGRETVCSPETAERIREAVDRLQYTPSSLVTAMQKSVRHAVGACIDSPWDSDIRRGAFFYERIWKGIFEQADVSGYAVLRYDSAVRRSNRTDALLDGRVDGVLLHAHSSDNIRAEKIAAAGMSTMLITRSVAVPSGCAAAYTDESDVVDLALDKLWHLGHRRIAHIAGPCVLSVGRYADDIAIRRRDAYTSWMTANDAYDPELVAETNSWHAPDLLAPITAWRAMLDHPTALLCANDELAVSAIEAINSVGWSVPENISVVGIDNSNEHRPLSFSLTTIDPHIDRLGREATEHLVKIIAGEQPPGSQVAVHGADWVQRSTTSPFRSKRF